MELSKKSPAPADIAARLALAPFTFSDIMKSPVSEFPKYRQFTLFNVYFVGLLAASFLFFAMSFRLGYKLPDKSLYQYALPVLAAWAAF
jgi:hypothetical protein